MTKETASNSTKSRCLFIPPTIDSPLRVRGTSRNCPACGVASLAATGYIAFCDACGHRWLATTEQEQEGLESALYTMDYTGYRPDPKFVETAKRVIETELAQRVPPPGRILDVGCGSGDFMHVAGSMGYTVEGIDISQASAEICKARGLNARAGNFLTESFSSKFDLITMWDVVEHLRDPAPFLLRAVSILSARGCIFAKIPGFGELSVGLSNRWPRAAGALLGAPSHVQYFDQESLSTLLSRTGFQFEWISGGNARSQMSGGSVKRRIIREVRKLVGWVSGDANLYVIARPTGTP